MMSGVLTLRRHRDQERESERERERESSLVGVVCVGFLGDEKESARLTVSWLSSCASSHAKYVYLYEDMYTLVHTNI